MTDFAVTTTRPAHAAAERAVAVWLLVCCAMVFAMIIIGGITRLTESGLSIVEWRPVTGVLPPLTEEAWQREFDLYRQFPEYQLRNRGMSLEEFKTIFWWEYIHRVWGRAIGVVFAVPFLYFLLRGQISRALMPKLVLLFALGGLQGALGWYMVQSGLVDEPRVSQYRLAAHLGLAFVIYGYMLWLALGLLSPRSDPSGIPHSRSFRRLASAVCTLVLVTVLSGAFVANLRAGLTYNTFPLMDGRLVPDGLLLLEPPLRNLFENVTTVQFSHRLLAMLTLVLVTVLWLRSRFAAVPPRLRRAVTALFGMALAQVALGISTLLLVVPLPLAVAHQAGAVVLFTLAVWTLHEAGHGATAGRIGRPRAAAPQGSA